MDEKPDGTQLAELIPFPKERIVRHHTVEGVTDALQTCKINHIEFLANKHVDSLINRLKLEGMDVGSAATISDIVLVYESVKSALARIYGIPHHLHHFVDSNYSKSVTDILEDVGDIDLEEVLEPDDMDEEDSDGDDDSFA